MQRENTTLRVTFSASSFTPCQLLNLAGCKPIGPGQIAASRALSSLRRIMAAIGLGKRFSIPPKGTIAQ